MHPGSARVGARTSRIAVGHRALVAGPRAESREDEELHVGPPFAACGMSTSVPWTRAPTEIQFAAMGYGHFRTALTGMIESADRRCRIWPLHARPRASWSGSTPGSARASSSRSTGASGGRSSTGWSAPGRACRRRARSPATSACRARRRCSRCSSSRPRAISPRAAARAPSVAEELPDDLVPRDGGPAGAAACGIPRCPGAGRPWRAVREGARRLDGPPRAFRIGHAGRRSLPGRASGRGSRAGGCAASRRPSSTTAIPRASGSCARPSRAHVQTARGTRCAADQVIVVAGAQQGFELVCRLLLDPGDRAWMEEPGYPGRAKRAPGRRRADRSGAGGRARAWTSSKARAERATPASSTSRPSHQYPLGVPMSLPRRLALLRWARAARAWVIEDDYDSEFRYGARPIPCLHGLDADGRVIYVGSFSKTLFPALRLGFLIVPTDLRDRLVAARAAADQHPPTIDQAVLADFIARGPLRPARAADAHGVPRAAGGAAGGGGAILRRRAPRAARWQTGLHALADLDGVDAAPGLAGGRRSAAWRRRRCRPTSPGRSPGSTASSSGSRRCAPMRPGEAWSGSRWRSRRPAVDDRGPAVRPRLGARRFTVSRGERSLARVPRRDRAV